MELYILRHGEAGKRLSSKTKDFNRRLTATGEKEVKAIAITIKNLKIKFELIITSPLQRANQTASIVAKTLNKGRKVEGWDELKPEGNRQELYHKLSQFNQASTVLIVGHEPYLSGMIGELIRNDGVEEEHVKNDIGSGQIVLKKAGLAKIRITSLTPKMQGELRWLLTPGLLNKIK